VRSSRHQVVAVHEHVLVLVIAHQAHQRRLEEKARTSPVQATRALVADVEAHVGVGHRLLDLALVAAKPRT
jgi:hypothetical protein